MKSRCILFHLFQFVRKCWQFFSGAEFWKNESKFKKGERQSFLVFTSSTKRENTHFHVAVVQWRQKNVQKSVMHVQSCCFVNLNLFLFFRSHWVCRRRCLSSHILVRGELLSRKEKSIISQKVSFILFANTMHASDRLFLLLLLFTINLEKTNQPHQLHGPHFTIWLFFTSPHVRHIGIASYY